MFYIYYGRYRIHEATSFPSITMTLKRIQYLYPTLNFEIHTTGTLPV